MAIKNRDYSVGEQLEALAAIFRHVLNRGEECVTIASEVEFIQNYMAIMESRFGRRVKIQIQTEPGLEKVMIPKLIIQPLVENAILHGAGEDERPLHVKVSATAEDGKLVISVSDNGAGIPEEVLEKLRDHQAGGSGVQNVTERLKLFFGPEAEVDIQSALGSGTRIVLTCPLKKQEEA